MRVVVTLVAIAVVCMVGLVGAFLVLTPVQTVAPVEPGTNGPPEMRRDSANDAESLRAEIRDARAESAFLRSEIDALKEEIRLVTASMREESSGENEER